MVPASQASSETAIAVVLVTFQSARDLAMCLGSLERAAGPHPLEVVVVDNASPSYHRPGVIAGRFAHEGWDTAVVDGRDHEALERALTRTRTGRPDVVVAEVEEKS